MGPLHGLRVIEIEGLGPAPFCGMMLADMGADVISVARASSAAARPTKISERGKPCVNLFSTDVRCSYANIVVRKELWDKGLNTVEKLATMKRDDGTPRVIAATAIGSGTWVYGNVVLSRYKAGGRPVNDQVKWANGGNTQTMLGGLKSGAFDAIMAVPVWMETAQTQGFGVPLYDITSNKSWMEVFGGDIPVTVGYALKATLESDAEMTQDYVTAIYKSMQWLKTQSPEAIYDKLGPRYMSTTPKEAVINEIKYYKAIFNFSLAIGRKEFENTKRVMIPWVTDKDYTYDALCDMRYVEAARKA